MVPPIDEQRRIVAALSAQLAQVERARAAASAQHQAIEALPAAHLKMVFGTDHHLPSGWHPVKLGECGEIVSGITLGRKPSAQPVRKVPYLRVANVKDGFLDLSQVNEIEATEAEIAKWRLQPGDLLLTEGGDRDKLGRGTVWRDEIAECIHQNHIFRVRLDESAYLPAFVAAQLNSSYGRSYFLAHAKQTTGIATINQRVLAACPLKIPPMEEQHRIAAMLSAQFAGAERARASSKVRLAALNQLPAALLRRIFAGA
jgi:type I restriction enzyme S subunit